MFRRLSLIAVAAAALLSVTAAPASAGITSDCSSPDSTSVFAPWLDPAVYFLAPDGGFEADGAGWDLDGASVVSGNESFDLSGPGASSLRVAAGDSATSPAVCVGLEHPTFRFVARRTSGSSLSTLAVSAVLPGGTELPVGVMTGSSSWQPSPVMLIAANLLPTLATDDSVDVRLRFTPVSGTWQVDDVYVDPWGSR